MTKKSIQIAFENERTDLVKWKKKAKKKKFLIE